MTAGRRLGQAYVAGLLDKLSDRDRAILIDLHTVRVLTGQQLTRLYFANLPPTSAPRGRRRVLGRLTALGLVITLDRRIGGARAGSSGLIYTLDSAGQRATALLRPEAADTARRWRRPWTPGLLFLRHSLDVSELYVTLRGHERAGALTLVMFAAEPAAWHRVGSGSYLKPDAYVVVRRGDTEDVYWIECDRATTSLPTLRYKLLSYVGFALSGQSGPNGTVPQVLLTVPDERRLGACERLVRELPEPGPRLVAVVLHEEAITYMEQRFDE